MPSASLPFVVFLPACGTRQMLPIGQIRLLHVMRSPCLLVHERRLSAEFKAHPSLLFR